MVVPSDTVPRSTAIDLTPLGLPSPGPDKSVASLLTETVPASDVLTETEVTGATESR
ncbi:hypothetical protein GCM10009751_19340 [Myceligenerans crystallogenes]|uniref:Uncharacterized protein n=1 Tax=Myceligenerans crystallogenes TaxID=316335 RepID=A0ABN2NDL9_9MICO